MSNRLILIVEDRLDTVEDRLDKIYLLPHNVTSQIVLSVPIIELHIVYQY